MNLFTQNIPYYHILKYLLFLLKHPVYLALGAQLGMYLFFSTARIDATYFQAFFPLNDLKLFCLSVCPRSCTCGSQEESIHKAIRGRSEAEAFMDHHDSFLYRVKLLFLCSVDILNDPWTFIDAS